MLSTETTISKTRWGRELGAFGANVEIQGLDKDASCLVASIVEAQIFFPLSLSG